MAMAGSEEIEDETTQDDSGPTEQAPAERQRVRLVYEKGEAIKFISHHDEFRLWERALRRADLPLLYKQGFHPQPHMQFAAPLGVGITGTRELIDITLSPPVPLPELAERVRAKLPPGVILQDLAEVPLKTTALQSLLIGADYTILIYAAPGELSAELFAERIATFWATTEIWRERERKGEKYEYNLRPLVFELRYEGYDPAAEEHRIFLRVQQRAGATGRPDEVVDALGLDDYARTLHRERLYYADQPDDVARFAQYPIIEQAAISRQSPKRRHKFAERPAPRTPEQSGRSISERAGDEFV